MLNGVDIEDLLDSANEIINSESIKKTSINQWKGDAKYIIFFVSNWLRGFNPRICPVFIRDIKSNPI